MQIWKEEKREWKSLIGFNSREGEKGESEDASALESSVVRSTTISGAAVDSGFQSFGCCRIENDGALAGCLSIRFVANGRQED